MNLPEDFKEFIELLNAHKVNYLIVGGYAVGFHSRPKFTNDLDIWVDNSPENAGKVLNVLKVFGFEELDIRIEDLTSPDRVIQLGYAPLRIDIMMSVSGLNFNEAYQNRVKGKYLGVEAHFASIDDILQNKKSSGRTKDLEDINWIRKYHKK